MDILTFIIFSLLLDDTTYILDIFQEKKHKIYFRY